MILGQTAGSHDALDPLLSRCLAELTALGHDFANRYFSHTVASVS
jgi:hypothetical protein